MADTPKGTWVKATNLGTYGKKLRQKGEVFLYSGPTEVERPVHDKLGNPQKNTGGTQKMKKETYFPSWMKPVEDDDIADEGDETAEDGGQSDQS